MIRRPNWQKYRIIIAAIVTVIAIATATVIYINRKIDRSVYDERKQMLTLATKTASTVLEQNTVSAWAIYDIIYSSLNARLLDNETIEEAVVDLNKRHDFDSDYYFLVDENGKYYCSDGDCGKLTDFSPYMDSTPDRMTLLTTLPHMNPENNFLICRGRLDKPITTSSNITGKVKILYYAYAQDMTRVKTVIGRLFPGAINTFIYDESGAMLYKDFGIKLLIDGYNIYPKFSQCQLPFGENPEELIRKCKRKEEFSVNLVINDKHYYFCSAPTTSVDWSMAFIVSEAYIADSSGSGFASVVSYILLIAIILALVLLYGIYSFVKIKSDAKRIVLSEQLATAMTSASKAKSEFLSNMSHDIRTPINGIMGITKIAKGAINNPERIKDCLNKIDNASHHLLSLVNDVLDMSRIESGKTKITNNPADIRMICDNCTSIIRGQMADRSIDLITGIECKHAHILADELHLRQIFINILGNAVKFTKDGGRIWFLCKETECCDERVTFVFEIRDTGIGMTKEFKEKIFDVFTQEENRERTNYKGTGLGMAITKQLVELMGGTIDIESEVNKGSTFLVTLTFNIDTEERQEETVVVTDTGIDGVKALLVEDNELNTEIAVELLTSNGAIVDTATNGREAVEMFSAKPAGTYDVILMDIMMPEMNGLEATKAIRSMEREDAARIPIIAMTANAFDDDIKATKAAGMNAHLSKPIEIKEVIRTVARFTRGMDIQ